MSSQSFTYHQRLDRRSELLRQRRDDDSICGLHREMSEGLFGHGHELGWKRRRMLRLGD